MPAFLKASRMAAAIECVAAKHAEELVSDLQKFSATEDFQDVEIKRKGGLSRPLTGKFSYLVFIHNLRPDLISIQEMRTPSPANEAKVLAMKLLDKTPAVDNK